jgi:hypothetical protein
MSTVFAPTSHSNAEQPADEQPHYAAPPPSSQLQSGPFAHQLSPSTAAYASSPPQTALRSSRTPRHLPSNGAMASANGNGSGNGNSNSNGQPMPVPGGRINGHAHGHNNANLREMGFAGPRSPPNNKSRQSARLHLSRAITDGDRHVTCPLQVLPTGRVPGWKGMSVSAFRRARH